VLPLSFRFKLILAMSLIVTGVTVATLLVTQHRVQQTYDHLFEEQFKAQINYFSENRLRQLDAAALKCREIATSPKLISALEKGNPQLIYAGVLSEFRDLSRPADLPPVLQNLKPNGKPADVLRQKALANAAAMKPAAMPFVRVVDAKGNILEAEDTRPGAVKKTNTMRRLADQMKTFVSSVRTESFQQQEFGYLAMDSEDVKTHLREFIVTPVFEPTTHEPLGALIVGFIVRDFGESDMFRFSGKALLSGIWLQEKSDEKSDDRIYTQTIPEAVLPEVAARVSAELKSGSGMVSGEPVVVNGIPHRLFFKVLNPDSPFPPAAEVCLYSLAEPLAEQAQLRTQVLSFGSLALLAAVGVILVTSKGFSRPLEDMVLATRRVQEGDFTVKLPVKGSDELGVLAASFNEMTEELALKERYKAVLAQVTDKEVAEQLISGQMSLGGEVRVVTVLFCDIRGFTALTEDMPPAEVITLLNEHMTVMNRIVHQHYGVVDKFVGDLIMAVFGAPKSYGNDALHAVRCALQMIQERHHLNQTARHPIEIGIGVATGEVVAGCMGSQDRLNYTVLGGRVNLASRLCSQAGGTELLIDEATFERLPDGALVEPTEPMPLKGFSTPVAAFRLTELGRDFEVSPSQ